MSVSVALATYNGAAYLREQLESLLAQTRMPDELVVSDDASTDETMQIIEEFGRTAPFSVKILASADNRGHELNFEKAIAGCTGDLIFLCDQDDVWLPSKIITVLQAFSRNVGRCLVVNDLEITNALLERTGHTVISQMRASGTWTAGGKYFIIGCATAFRRELLDLVLPIPPLKYGHDRWLHAVAEALEGRLVVTEALQLYRRHGNNASTLLFDGARSPGWKDMVGASGGLDMRRVYANQRKVLGVIEARLEFQDDADHIGTRPKEAALAYLRNAQSAYDRRISLLGSDSVRRKLRAISMYLRGDYRYFLGWRSLAKDLIR